MPAKLKALTKESEVRTYLFDLLARRDYTRAQLLQKLKLRDVDLSLAEQILDSFERQGYQSDKRFVESQVRQRLAQGQGRRKIEYELRHKGISSDLAESVLQKHDEGSEQRALEYLRKRYGDQPADDHKERAKRFRHMVSRGFSFDEINYALRHQANSDDIIE